MKKLLPLFAIIMFWAAIATANGFPAASDFNSINRTYFQPGQDQLVRDIELYPNPDHGWPSDHNFFRKHSVSSDIEHNR